ncbi:dimethylarginine dimethylaminohydrolase family protein [Aequorivita echinoideorum]|uniref:arginine deiminase n=1 Tax=Aequorivita echinoideorum TaxID=1549647 RepID=A0ABS5S3Z5_9FLAO|nr:arginine deiminase family protein [Aequorivita echinoideorum]MBT0606565.1 amidinotransferase [Aequorivita echinoideorum]
MIQLNINDEISPLKAVVLGRADSNGPVPLLENAYDPKSAEHIKAGTYPKDEDMVREMEAVAAVFKKYGVTVYRPEPILDYNQIFTRDIAFVIEDKFIIANILEDRSKEIDAMHAVLEQIDPSKIVEFPEHAHIEGGDVMPWGDYIFVGTYYGEDYPSFITARTNMNAVRHLQKLFPHKKVKSFSLKKSNTVADENALHLDCCFQPLGKGKAIIHEEGFLIKEEYEWLVNFFGKENCFHITKREMYDMNSNVFSLSPEVVISEKNFTRLNTWLREQGFTVEEVPYAEISKQEGLLRCTTMPLVRE